jgi:PKD repeat protein
VKNAIWAVFFLSLSGFLFSVRPVSAQVDTRVLGPSSTVSGAGAVTTATRDLVLEKYAQLPLRFEANQGQTDNRVRFLSRGSGYTLFLMPTEAVLSVSEPLSKSSDSRNPDLSRTHYRTSVLRMELSGAKPDSVIAGRDELPGRSNYFIGNDPKQWHTGIPAFKRVTYKDIYPGVDLVYYGNQRQLEYDFVIAPGANPNAIRLNLTGSRQVRIDKQGDVLIRVGSKDLRLGAPNVYQEDGGKRHAVSGKWLQSRRHQLRFDLGAYDHSKALIVDPTLTLVYSTFLGGSLADVGAAVAVDSLDHAYIAGYTGSADFPSTPNAVQATCHGCTGTGTNNAFIAEIDLTGPTVVYATFLGGSNGDAAFGIAVDSNGDAFVVGTANSTNFPTMNPFQAACAGGCANGNSDSFVTEIGAGGGSLVFSTYLGGTGKEKGNAIALDASGNVYVAGSTSSTDFYNTNGYQTSNGGGTDAFVTKFNSSGSALLYSTYLGGTLDDEAYAIAVDSSNSAYVAGVTYSSNFPTASPLQSTNGGNGDGFVTKFNSAGSALAYSTFLGGSALDQVNGIALDSANNVYVVGNTASTNFPTKSAYQASCASCASGTSDAFVTKINTSGSALVYSTYLGGTGLDLGNSIAVDSLGETFVGGQTSSIDFPTANSSYSVNSCNGCTNSAFVTEFDVAGDALVFSTYLGGTAAQSANAIAVDPNGEAVVTGATSSTDFPTTSNKTQPAYGGGTDDAFITEFPAAANCTNSFTQADTPTGSTINITLICNGNFFLGNGIQFLGFQWGDGTQPTGSGSGCPASNGCTVTSGTASFPASHTYASNGSYTGTNTVTDASGNNIITTGFSVTVPLISITPTTLPGGTVGTTYNQLLTATGGTAPYTWSVTAGSLAPLTLSSTGLILGTPTTAGTLSFTVQAKDAMGNTSIQAFSIVIANAPLTIQTQPASQTINSGQTATMTVGATGGTGTLTYQWYQGSSGITTNPISGATSTSYTTPALTATTSYWVQVKDGAEHTANSNTATITVVTPPLTITTQPASQTISSGQTATMTVTANGGTGTLTYQWYQGSSGTTTNPINGATSASYTTPALKVTTSYWVQVKDGAGNTANSNTATVTVVSTLTITTQPVSQTIISGQTATMTVAATGGSGTLTYQWYLGSSGTTTNPISGAINASYTTPALTATTSYWVQVKDGAGNTANSNTATITVAPALTITTQPVSQTILSGQTATMTVAATGGSGTLTYQWYLGSSGTTTNPVSGATSASYTTPALTTTTSYWVQVKDGAGQTASSNTATITVSSPLTPPTCPQPSVQSGTDSLTVTATSNCTDSDSSITSTTFTWGDDSSSSSGSPATHTYASAGTYTITVTATDANNLSSSASTTVAVTARLTTLVTPGQAATQTVNVTAPPGVSSLVVTYQCLSADGPSGVQPLGFYHLSCDINSQGATSKVTLTSTPTPVSIAVQTAGTTAQQSELRSGRLGGLYAAFLFLPGVVLMGVGLSGHRRKKMVRYAGLLLLGLMIFSWLGCGGTIAPPPAQTSTPAGAYSVSVTGTSSSGTQTTITVGFTVGG